MASPISLLVSWRVAVKTKMEASLHDSNTSQAKISEATTYGNMYTAFFTYHIR